MDKQELRELLGCKVMGWALQTIGESDPVKHYPICPTCGIGYGYAHEPDCSYMLDHRKWTDGEKQLVMLVENWKPDEDLNQAFQMLEKYAFQNARGIEFGKPFWETTGEGIKWHYTVIVGSSGADGCDLAEVICEAVRRDIEYLKYL